MIMAHSLELPPMLYVPLSDEAAAPADAKLEYRLTKDGRKALLAYSALDRLQRGMGTEQPWAVVPTAQLENFREVDQFDTVVLDIVMPVRLRRGAEGDAAREAEGEEQP